MRKIIILAVFCLILSAISFAQVPQKMSYQAVVRGSDNNLVTNQQVAMRVSILQGSVDGTAVYTETHSATTNANGLLTIEIGDGTSNDDFTAINWANGPFFVKTETDVNGGDDYDIIGVSQLLSVPYAMYAQTAGNMPDVSGFLTEEADPTVPSWAKAETKPVYNYSEIEGTPEIPTVPTNVSAFENDANYLQSESDPTVPTWAKAETKPSYSYEEITGKPELFSGNYNDLTNTPAIPTVPTNVSAFTNDANYLTSYTESDPTVPSWAKTETKPSYSYEEITGKPELFSGNYNDLTNKPTIPTVPTSVSAFENDANYITLAEIPAESQTLADVAALGNSMNNTQIKNVATPTEDKDATTKKYVDDLIAALQAQNEALQETLSAVICNITFDANGGTGTMNPQTMVKGAAQAITTNTFTKENYTFAGWNTAADGSGTSYTDGQSITISGNMTLYAQWRDLRGILNGYEWVDLGLPSGLLWATCNVGANNPEAYGDYFAWGETTPKDSYTEENYTYSDNPETLPASADAATANWGEGWRMPTQTEMQELIDNCTHEWTTQNEVNGRLFTGPNGNSIFLPAAGYCDGSRLYGVGYYGYYRSSSLDSFLYFTSGFYHMRYYFRFCGHSVRPVCVQ